MADARIESGHILHLDMDAFFAAVEVLDNPALRGLPLVIGSAPDQRGVVSTASYEARTFGVHSAMPSRTAGKLCPHAVFLPPRMDRYVEISGRIMAVIESFSPLLEPVSIDEAFVDVRGALRKWKTSVELARALKARIRADIGLTASVGVAPNKFLAKLASDLQKPDGLTVVPVEPAAIAAFLAPMPVKRIWGVGQKAEARLVAAGFPTIGSLQAADFRALEKLAGAAMARHITELAWGRDDRPVVTEYEAKSMSAETTFDEDNADPAVWRQTLVGLAEEVGSRLRRDGKVARVGHLKFRFGDFSTYTRQRAFAAPTHRDRDLIACALELLGQQTLDRPLRLLGFGASDLADPAAARPQPELFPDLSAPPAAQRDARLDQAVDRLREKFGKDIVKRGV